MTWSEQAGQWIRRREKIIGEQQQKIANATENMATRTITPDLIETKLGRIETRLKLRHFKLGGLGKSAKGCGDIVASDIDIGEKEDGVYKVRYNPVDCLRIQCPHCYGRWALERTFSIVLRIEAMALIRNERPFHVVYSVPPKDCKGWTWSNVNDRIWKRGVRHLKRIRCKQAGKSEHRIKDCPDCRDLSINEYAGIGIFHPLRVRKRWKLRWNADPDPDSFGGLIGSGKFWKKIRFSIANGLGSLNEYAKIGYHAHNWIFNERPHRHKDKKFLVKYLEDGSGEFKRFSRKEVIAFTRYLITHTCVISERTTYTAHQCQYCKHIVRSDNVLCGKCGRYEVEEVEVERNRIVHPVRSYGSLLRFKPKEELIKHFGKQKGRLLYDLLAREICSYLILREKKNGDYVTLGWNSETEDLEYPAWYGSSTPEDGENWVSVWKVFDLLIDEDFTERISDAEYEFLEDLAHYIRHEGKPPPLKRSSHVPVAGMFYVPNAISVDALSSLEDWKLQEKILRLIDAGENDVWKLDICLPDYSFGDILTVVNRLIDEGVVKDVGGDLSIKYAEAPYGDVTQKDYTADYRHKATKISEEIVRLIGSGARDFSFILSCFPSAPECEVYAVLDKLLEDGVVIRQPDGKLLLGGKK